MRNVYLDYSATTPVKEEVLKEMIPYFTEKFGNPSSLYDKGLESKDAITVAREQVASLINAKPAEIFFTAGGTESDNWVVFGVADKLREKGNHIITTKNIITNKKLRWNITYFTLNFINITSTINHMHCSSQFIQCIH